MFSATWPSAVRDLALNFQTNPVFINVGSMQLSANHNIEQKVEVIDEHAKLGRFYKILEDIMKTVSSFIYCCMSVTHDSSRFQPENKTLVFTETKRKADELTHKMRKDGWPVVCIHGDKSQAERDWVMRGGFLVLWWLVSTYSSSLSEFREGRVPILLATGVASRGLGEFSPLLFCPSLPSSHSI